MARRSREDFIFYSHLRPKARVGGEATARGMFLRLGGLGSSIDIVKGMGLSTRLGSALKGVKGGFSLSFAYFSSIIGSETKFCKFLNTLSIDISSFRGNG